MRSNKQHIDLQKQLTIGLVLTATPKYSETFFINKINGLVAQGHNIVLFVDIVGAYKNDNVTIVKMPSLEGNNLRKSMVSALLFLKAILMHPIKTIRHYLLDKKDGISFSRRVKNIILNQVFFSYKLDWLHFGFGMFVINRENVAETINAQMAVSFRGSDLYLSPLRHKNCYDSLFTKKVRYHVLSNQMKETLMDYNVGKNDIYVINPAISIDLFKGAPRTFLNKKLRIATTARLHWKKGLVYTLEALAILKRKNIDFEYVLIGEGDQRERLLFAAHQLGISDHITLTGKLQQAEIIQHLKDAEIYLQYSIQEGFCNSVLEAQAMGLLCIVSNADGLDENIKDGESGWVIQKRQPEFLANKIMEVYHLPEKAKKDISNNAIKRVEKEFNLEKQKNEFSVFYTS